MAVDLLQNGTTCVATTQYDTKGYPNEDINKASVAGFDMGMTQSTTLGGKVHCFMWLDAKPVFLLTQSWDALYTIQSFRLWRADHP